MRLCFRCIAALCVVSTLLLRAGAFSRKDQYAKAQQLRFEAGDKGARKQAFDILKALAAEGDDDVTAQAAADLSQMYLFGDEGVVAQSLPQSHAFAQRASNLANGQGSYILAFLMLSRFWPADGALRDPDSGYRPSKEALDLLEASARRGYTPARMALAFRLLYGFEMPSNCEAALQLYKDAAAESLSLQGTIESVTLDEPERLSDDLIRWLQHANVVEEEQREYLFAAAKSDASVAFELGVAMLSGRAYGIKKDVPRAIQYLSKAAKDMSYAPAAGLLGQVFLTGAEVDMDLAAAMEYLDMGAKQGDPRSMSLLGKLLLRPEAVLGEGASKPLDQDIDHGLTLLQAAAEYDEPIALYELAAYWRKQGHAARARNFYTKAIELGYLNAVYDFAEMIEFGEAGLVQSCDQAAKSYKFVAESGPWVEGIRHAFQLMQNNNYESAVLMLSMAAEEGYEVAQYDAAWLLESRLGYRGRDRYQKALRYYGMALLQNDQAHVELGRLNERGADGVPVDLAAAAFHYRSAYERLGDQKAAERYARLLETGRGVAKDLEQARSIYQWLLKTTNAASAATQDDSGFGSSSSGNWLHSLKRKTGLWFKLARNELNRRMAPESVNSQHRQGEREGEGAGEGAGKERQTDAAGSRKETSQDRPSDGNLFFISDEKDGACLSVNGEFGDCTLDCLFSFSPAAVSIDGTAAAGFLAAPFVQNQGFLREDRRFEVPFLVPMDCHDEITPLVAGVQSACQAGGWGVMSDRLVMHDGELCMRRSKNYTAVLQPCAFGATPIAISGLGPLEAGGVIFQVQIDEEEEQTATTNKLCLAGEYAIPCDHGSSAQRWGVQLVPGPHTSFLQFYRTSAPHTSKPCLGVDEDGRLILESCLSETASRWRYDNGRLVFALDDDPYHSSASDRSGGVRHAHVACVGLEGSRRRAVLVQCEDPAVVRFDVAG